MPSAILLQDVASFHPGSWLFAFSPKEFSRSRCHWSYLALTLDWTCPRRLSDCRERSQYFEGPCCSPPQSAQSTSPGTTRIPPLNSHGGHPTPVWGDNVGRPWETMWGHARMFRCLLGAFEARAQVLDLRQHASPQRLWGESSPQNELSFPKSPPPFRRGAVPSAEIILRQRALIRRTRETAVATDGCRRQAPMEARTYLPQKNNKRNALPNPGLRRRVARGPPILCFSEFLKRQTEPEILPYCKYRKNCDPHSTCVDLPKRLVLHPA